MGATLAQIREGLAANLATLDDVQVSPYMLDSPTPPTLQVMGPDQVTYDLAMRGGLDEWTMIVQGFAGGATDKGAQILLDEWISAVGAKSVKAALESDITLGGLIPGLNVQNASGYRIYQLENRAAALGCEWQVTVYNPGS